MLEQARRLGIDAERLTFGVDLDRWPPLPPRPRPPGRTARLLFVGSLNRVKDPSTLLRAAARLRRTGRAFRLDIVGEDTLGGAVQREARIAGLEDAVHFHGFLPHARLRPLMERADLLVVSSRHEADPIALLEAAVAGVPAVGTAVGHLAEWAPDAALVAPVGDADALARAVAALLDDDARRVSVAARAQARALALDADRTAREVLSAYAALASRNLGVPNTDWRRVDRERIERPPDAHVRP